MQLAGGIILRFILYFDQILQFILLRNQNGFH